MFKVKQRVKYNKLRGTVFHVFTLLGGKKAYDVVMDNGARVSGTDKQFVAVRKA